MMSMNPSTPSIFSVLALCLTSPAAAATEAPPDLASSYTIDARFDPATGALSVQGTMDVVADRRIESLRLLLNDAMRVRSFTLEGREARMEPSYLFGEQRVPGGQAIVVPLESALEQRQRARLAFRHDAFDKRQHPSRSWRGKPRLDRAHAGIRCRT